MRGKSVNVDSECLTCDLFAAADVLVHLLGLFEGWRYSRPIDNRGFERLRWPLFFILSVCDYLHVLR